MTSYRGLVGVALVGIVHAGAPAHAEGNAAPGEPEATAARRRLGLSIGLFAQFGELGFEYAQLIGRTLEIGVGGGLGLSGPQGFVMPRIHGRGSSAPDVGLGMTVSRAQSGCLSGPADCASDSAVAVWANLELGWTMRTDRAFVRIFVGVTGVVARGPCRECSPIETGLVLPSFGFTGGFLL